MEQLDLFKDYAPDSDDNVDVIELFADWRKNTEQHEEPKGGIIYDQEKYK